MILKTILTSFAKREQIESILAYELEDAMRHDFSEGKAKRVAEERAKETTDRILEILAND